jgi:hypothetical protein
MKRLLLLATSFVLISSLAQAVVHGVAVQVNEGKKIPTVAQLKAVLAPGDLVRDVLGWHKVDPNCNLRTNPELPIAIPAPMATLYQNVVAAGGKNFVTLAFNNRNCGQPSNGGGATFPNTAALRAEFAAYAVRVVQQVPGLAGVSIWNELNGTWDGGYTNRADKLRNYCLLANEVIREVRKIDANIPIAIGATVGWNVDTWLTEMFDDHNCLGRGDPTIWLDVHPYLSGKIDGASGKTDWQLWNEEVGRLRARGIGNPLIATEWGAKAANTWLTENPGGNYIETFEANVVAKDSSWAATTWYQLLYDKKTPNAGLFDKAGTSLTTLGMQYVNEFDGQ